MNVTPGRQCSTGFTSPNSSIRAVMTETPPKSGTLFIVATPIGNLRDITLRALEVLGAVDMIAAEDTRNTAHLLSHHGISANRLMAVHQHNERGAAEKIVA